MKQAVWPPGSADMVCRCPSVTLTFDRLTLKLVCESHIRWGTFVPNLGISFQIWLLGSRIIHYVRDEQTDGQTDGQKRCLLLPSLWSGA